ncbi:hypothetical protein ACH4TC_21965 [Streptomyces spororaveus]|uniref:hypothetical protein n=1 Tax=Streptomyces spororaveus TaxID=284039 RepID=UPI0037883270
MSAHSDRRWAERTRELEFTRLPELRRQAEGWRTGLTGLTTLLAVLVLLKGRDNLAELPQWARATATGLLVAAFVLLVAGSLLAVRAAHGVPGEEILLGGRRLKDWTEQEVSRVTRALGRASACCLLGVLLVVGALLLAWVTTSAAPDHLVDVRTTTGGVCGELVAADGQQVSLRTGAGSTLSVPQASIVSLRPARTCGTAP